MISLIFIVTVILLYFFEIRWRKKHNKPLNKGKPIDGGQYLIFWVVSSVAMLAISIVIAFFFENTANLFLYSVFEHVFSPIYSGYTASEPAIMKSEIPYFVEYYKRAYHIAPADEAAAFEFLQHINFNQKIPYETIATTNQSFVETVYFYRDQIMVLTMIVLVFGRKFIYAPFFEMKKVENFTINKISLFLQLLITALFMSGLCWFIFFVPTHSDSCPKRILSFWCMDLGGKGPRYFSFPTLLLFYWTFLLIAINAFTQAVLTEFGYIKHKENKDV